MERLNTTTVNTLINNSIDQSKRLLRKSIKDLVGFHSELTAQILQLNALIDRITAATLIVKVGNAMLEVDSRNISSGFADIHAIILKLRRLMDVVQPYIDSQIICRGPEQRELAPLVAQGQRLPSHIVQIIMMYHDYEGKNYWLLSKKLCMASSISRSLTFPVHVIHQIRTPNAIYNNTLYNGSAESLHLIGFINQDRIRALMNADGSIPCPDSQCSCCPSIAKMHRPCSVTDNQISRYCYFRIQDLFSPGYQAARLNDLRTVSNTTLNTQLPDVRQWKRHSALMIRPYSFGDASLFFDNRPWLEHLRRYGVDVKITFHELPQYGINQKALKQSLSIGCNFFNGECRDKAGFVFRIRNAKSSPESVALPYGTSFKTQHYMTDGRRWLPDEIYHYYTEGIKVNVCFRCGKSYKKQHTRCVPRNE